jgi:CheY-like chemotaxis protein
VIEARNFEAARSYMVGHQRKIRLILLDIGLKDPNQISLKETDTAGIDFAEWVLNDNILSDIPIIVHTASSVAQIARQLKDMGVKEVVRKGRISPTNLTDMIMRYIDTPGWKAESG